MDGTAVQAHATLAMTQLSVAVETEWIGGNHWAMSRQVLPSSALWNRCPILVPTYTPAGSNSSVAIPSLKQPMYASPVGKPFERFFQALPAS
jgi:hypothetical protein